MKIPFPGALIVHTSSAYVYLWQDPYASNDETLYVPRKRNESALVIASIRVEENAMIYIVTESGASGWRPVRFNIFTIAG